ncbi:MAG: Ig-like domain-containing protein [Pseudomonadota bacterium]
MQTKNFPRLFYFIVCFLGLILSSSDIPAEWSNLGLYGGRVYSVAIDPVLSGHILAGGDDGGGAWESLDSGKNWKPLLTGKEGTVLDGEATFSNTTVRDIRFSQSKPAVVWAVHDHWAEKSNDSGKTWEHISNETMQEGQSRFCHSVAIDSVDEKTVYIGTGGVYSDTFAYGAVYKTNDGGQSWIRSGPHAKETQVKDAQGNWVWTLLDNQFPFPIVDIKIDPQNVNVLYVISTSGEGASAKSYLYRSGDGAKTWYQIGYLPSEGLKEIAIHPDKSNIIFVTGYHGVKKFYTRSNTWTYVKVFDSSGSDCKAITFQPGDGSTLFVSGRNSYFGISTDSGESFATWLDIDHQLIAIAASPQPAPFTYDIFGGDLSKGIVRGSYAPKSKTLWSWQNLNKGVNAVQVHDMAVNPEDSGHYLAATAGGLYEKMSPESIWVKKGDFLNVSAYCVIFGPDNPRHYYVGTQGGIYKTEDSGDTWRYRGLEGGPIVTKIAVPEASADFFYVTTRGPGVATGYVYKIKKDLSQASVINQSDKYHYNAIAVHPEDPQIVYAGGGSYSGTRIPGDLYLSKDGGESWIKKISNVIVNDILIDPKDPDTLYAGCGHFDGTDIPLFMSTDKGETWYKSYKGIPGEPTRYGIWGTSLKDFYVLRHTGSTPMGGEDDQTILYFNGDYWQKKEIPVSASLYAMWGSSSNNVWAVGKSGTAIRFNGETWSNVDTGAPDGFDFHDIWGLSSNFIVAVGNGRTIFKYDGSTWQADLNPTQEQLSGVWGVSEENFFAVGSFGTILRYDGSNWLQVKSPVTVDLQAIWGSDASNAFAVGAARKIGSGRYYTILNFSGTQWTLMETPLVPDGNTGMLRSIWGTSKNNIYAVGDNGTILHFDGSGWSVVDSGKTFTLHAVWGASDTIYASGDYGIFIRYTDKSWSDVPIKEYFSDEGVTTWNSVTDLSFTKEGHIYAGTNRQGIFASVNKGRSWLNMGTVPYSINTVQAGSVITGGSAGTHSLAGEGLFAGFITESVSGSGLYEATVQTDMIGGPSAQTETDGSWSMLHPAGIHDVTASKPGYAPRTETGVRLYDGSWTSVSMALDDPVVTIEMNGTESLAVAGTFACSGGRIVPETVPDCPGYGWTDGTGGRLRIPYGIGCVKLSIQPDAGYRVVDVSVNKVSMGVLSDHTFNTVYDAQSMSVIFEQINYAPTKIELTPSSVTENSSGQTAVGTLSTTDENLADTHTYSFVSNTDYPDNSFFTINGAVLETKTSTVLDHETKDTYTIRVETNDGHGGIYIQSLLIHIDDINEKPEALPDTYAVMEDIAKNVSASGVLENDTDPDEGDKAHLSAHLVSGPGHALSFTLNADGSFNYTPAANYSGADGFSYKAKDEDTFSDTVWVSLTINEINDAPSAADESVSTNEDTPVVINVVDNFTDVDGTLKISSVFVTGGAAHGTTLVDTMTGMITYSPLLNYTGTDHFTYTLSDDDDALSNQATVTVIVNDQNDSPVANNDSKSTKEDTFLEINVIGNDSDVDGTLDPSSVRIISNPAHGTVNVNVTTGSITYTPDPDYNGPDSFTYSVKDDDAAESNHATVTISVGSMNDTPVAVSDSYSVDEDTELVIDSPGILNNDTDSDNDPLTASMITGPGHAASFLLNPNGSFCYTPATNYYGSDSFTYKVSDGIVDSSTQQVTIIIQDRNDSPVSGDDSVATEKETPIIVNILGNDTDIDGTVLADTVLIVRAPYHGSVDVDPVTGKVTYTPFAGYHGSDSFMYTVQDNDAGVSNAAKVSIAISNTNAPPVLELFPDQDSLVGQSFFDIRLDDFVTDPDNDDNEITWTYSGNNHLCVTITSRVAHVSAIDDTWTGSETILFTATDPGNLFDSQPVTFTRTLKGDINQNGSVDLGDLILAFKVLDLSSSGLIIDKKSDVNADGKVGMEEIFYILKHLSD